MKNETIGVLMGGPSAEREVSLESGRGVFEALVGRGYDAVAIDWKPGDNVAELLTTAGVTVVWNALHGTLGEDGAVQGLCACLGIPCTGSGILSSAIAMDKVASKRVFQSSAIPTARWRVVEPGESGIESPFGYPVVVKPSLEGSSVGVSIVHRPEDLAAAIELARAHEGETMLEEFIAGAEVCTGILGSRVLGSCEIRPAVEFYDYDAKYKRDDTQYLAPPPLPAAVLARVETLALDAHRALGCSGYSRVDFRVPEAGEPSILEVNTLPGMTSHSLLPKVAALAGLTYADLCEEILRAVADRR